MHCTTLVKEKKKKEKGDYGVTFLHYYEVMQYESCLACHHFTGISKLLIGHLPPKYNNGKGILFPVEQAFVGRGRNSSSTKNACVGGYFQAYQTGLFLSPDTQSLHACTVVYLHIQVKIAGY